MPDSPAINLRLHSASVRPGILTFRDLIEHGMRFLGGAGTQSGSQEEVRQSVISAYEEMSYNRRWRYYTRHGRVTLQSNQTTGTIEYTHSTRRMTLTGATWPANVTRGYVKTGSGTLSRVQKEISTTVIELDPVVNPGADIASGTTYEWYRSIYMLPPDFLSLHSPLGANAWWHSHFMPHHCFLEHEKYAFSSSPQWCFTIVGTPGAYGGMALHVWGSPGTVSASNRNLDFSYVAMPSPLAISGFEKSDNFGTVAATSGSATLTGTSTEWWSGQNGAVIRISRNSRLPTDATGLNLFSHQGIIETVDSTTSITLANSRDDDVVLPSTTESGRGFVISSPIDAAPWMQNALRRGVEWHLAQSRNMKNAEKFFQQYQVAFRHAASQDGMVTHQRQWAGEGPSSGHRLGRDGEVGAETNGYTY